MNYYILSYTHKNTDIDMREKLAFDVKNEDTKIFLSDLVSNKFIDESIILSTCNRIEFIMYVNNQQKAEEYLFEKLSDFSNIELEELKKRAASYTDISAIHHLFSVASSLDSLVIGETQISGQLKTAFKFSYDLGYCKLNLSRAIHYAFKCAALVRNSTNISKNSVSVASTAVAKAKDILGSLVDKEALIIGAGEMSMLCAKHLVNANANIIITNREMKNAEKIRDDILQSNPNANIKVESFKEIGKLINSIPLVFSATGAPHSIITADLVSKCDFDRYWFDLAVPRDIDSIDMDSISIFAVDDLQDIVQKNLALREEQARAAYGIVGRYTQEFFSWIATLSSEPLIKLMRQKAKESSLREIQKGISKGYLPREYEKNIEKTLHNAFNVFLHDLTINLKAVSNTQKGDMVIEALQFLFNDNSDPKMTEKYKCEYESETKQ